MDFPKVFCDVVKEYTVHFVSVDWIMDTASFWLREVRFCAERMITASIETVQIFLKDFFRRIHQTFAIVSVF